jgi:hypothetical protein
MVAGAGLAPPACAYGPRMSHLRTKPLGVVNSVGWTTIWREMLAHSPPGAVTVKVTE